MRGAIVATFLVVLDLIAATTTVLDSLPHIREGTVYWTGDFSTGDWSQYNGIQSGKTFSPWPTIAYDNRTENNGNTSATIQSAITRPGYPYAVKLDGFNGNEVQNIIASGANGGTFTMSWGGSISSAITYNASGSVVAAALNAMPSIQSVGGLIAHGVDREQSSVDRPLPNSKIYIIFNNPGPQAGFTADSSNLVGGSLVVAQGDDTAIHYPHRGAALQHWGGGNANHTKVGDDTYYGLSLYVPSSNVGHWDGGWAIFWELIAGGWGNLFEWNIFTNGHAGSSPTNPILAADFQVNPDGSYGGPVPYEWTDSGTLPYDTWIDLVVHINWQTSASGVFEVWKNGTKAYSKSGIRTAPNTSSNIDMIGPNFYTDENPQMMTWYLTANRIGDSYAAVAP